MLQGQLDNAEVILHASVHMYAPNVPNAHTQTDMRNVDQMNSLEQIVCVRPNSVSRIEVGERMNDGLQAEIQIMSPVASPTLG